MSVNGLKEGESIGLQALEQVGAAKAHEALARTAQVFKDFALGRSGLLFLLWVEVQTQSVARHVQGVDLVHYLTRVQACIAVRRVTFIHRKSDRKRLAHGEVAFFSVFAADEAAAMLVGLGVVLEDEAARAAHHVQANQFAPVVELVAFFNGKDGVHTALVFALKLGFTDSVFAHVPLGADTNVGLLINEQAQLGREVVLGLVVWRRGQQDDFGIAALDVFRNGFVAPTFAVAQVMAFVNEYQAVALEVGQLFGDLRHWQHHAAQAVFCAVVLPHRLQVFGANDECFVA